MILAPQRGSTSETDCASASVANRSSRNRIQEHGALLPLGGWICAHSVDRDASDLHQRFLRRRLGSRLAGSGALQGRIVSRLSRAQHARREADRGRRSHASPSRQPDHESPDLPFQGRLAGRGNHGLFAARKLPAHQLSPGAERPGVPARNGSSITASTGQVTVQYTDDDGNEKDIQRAHEAAAGPCQWFDAHAAEESGPDAAPLEVSMLVATPKPRLVKLAISSQPKEPFTLAGAGREALQYVNQG